MYKIYFYNAFYSLVCHNLKLKGTRGSKVQDGLNLGFHGLKRPVRDVVLHSIIMNASKLTLHHLTILHCILQYSSQEINHTTQSVVDDCDC